MFQLLFLNNIIIFIMNKIMNYYYNTITEYINYNLLNKFCFEYQES